MSGVLFYLSHNPDAYAYLSAEIRTRFSSGYDSRHGPQLNGCKYLRAVLDETMRTSPSTLAVAWREQNPASLAAGETSVVDGHVITSGTQIGLSNYSLQHKSAIFSEAFSLRPERWLPFEDSRPETTVEQNARIAMQRASKPFSVDDRSCAGTAMAYMEVSLAVAKTIWYFDFEKAPGRTGQLREGTSGRTNERGRLDEFQLYEGVVVDHNGPNLVFMLREDSCKELGSD